MFAAAADAAAITVKQSVRNTLNHALTDMDRPVQKNWFDSECEVFFAWDVDVEECVGVTAHGEEGNDDDP